MELQEKQQKRQLQINPGHHDSVKTTVTLYRAIADAAGLPVPRNILLIVSAH